MKFVVCYLGAGEGCDYTIGCNKTFSMMDADSLEDLKNKLHADLAGYENVSNGKEIFAYMSGVRNYDYEHTYESVFVVPGELIDISDDLRQKINEGLGRAETLRRQEIETEEKELYQKLKQKYG